MYNIAIIGAGQLGSRHLQGVKQSNNKLNIWVYDPNKDSLDIAEERYNQISTSIPKIIHFVQSMNEIPIELDIVIIATSSKPRFSIIKNLLSKHRVKYLILEKFLFQRISEYDIIEQLIKEKHIKAYVNCPRRMLDCYQLIKINIDDSNPIHMIYSGMDWGLCCNSIRFIDIFMYICNAESYELNIDEIIPEIIESKREGYVELRGKEVITTPKGDSLILASYERFDKSPIINIINGNTKIEFSEILGKLDINGILYEKPIKYQSTLSGVLIDELINTGNCKLTTYKDSAHYHKIYLKKILPFINRLRGIESDNCPIT